MCNLVCAIVFMFFTILMYLMYIFIVVYCNVFICMAWCHLGSMEEQCQCIEWTPQVKEE